MSDLLHAVFVTILLVCGAGLAIACVAFPVGFYGHLAWLALQVGWRVA